MTETTTAGLTVVRHFTKDNHGKHPFELVPWEIRSAVIKGENGAVVFEQHGIEVPSFWSVTATNIVASKYFRGEVGTPWRETSVKSLINRVAHTITRWGVEQGYFSEESAEIFLDELTHLLLHQMLAFNSPVWFNVGVENKPQSSACFINSVQDTMESILELAKTEGMLFKFGSGTGSNLSVLRGSKETLAGGGTASGPVSFMRGYDAFAGVIKSGGKTRRAAKMVILNADHPDIEEFITCKADEERKAHALIDAGYDGSFNVKGGAYDSVFFQNANHSVRVTDEFMQCVIDDKPWETKAVKSRKTVATIPAKDLMRKMAQAAWECGDPGIQFDTTINSWHTCPESGRINASNPCSEFLFLDDTSCNLASLNLMKFTNFDGDFSTESFSRACEISITAQEILVGNSSYPTPTIEKNSHAFRPLGLGYANLGALLMHYGLPYDSETGRDLAAAITALMHAAAYRQSAMLAILQGPFEGFAVNRTSMLARVERHAECARNSSALTNEEDTPAARIVARNLMLAAVHCFDMALEIAENYGFRNSQVTVLAPTGTIGFMMDCDTTGIEPELALVKYKKLVGGGVIKIVNQSVEPALSRLFYSDAEIKEIVRHIEETGTIEGAPRLAPEHLAVFDCAFKPQNGTRSILPLGHIRMMAAVQPFLSGAISKTVNMPTSATVEDIENAYIIAWKLGLKSIAVYRDGCKRSQPLSTSKKQEVATPEATPLRRKLPDERPAITHKFQIAGHEGYVTVGMYPDGKPGELFICMSKEGSSISGLMDALATAVSISLQYGVPLETLVDKFSHVRYEPSGFTKNPDIPHAKSITDYIFRWLGNKFLSVTTSTENSVATPPPTLAEVHINGSSFSVQHLDKESQTDAPPCSYCGTITTRSGTCYRCANCGSTTGCS